MTRRAHSPIIGGMFALETPAFPLAPLSLPVERSLFFANARSAIFSLVRALRSRRVWLPSYLCSAVLEALAKTNSAIAFYEVNEHLQISSDDWIEQVREGDLVLLISYFGVPISAPLVRRLKQNGAWILDDASQAFPFSHLQLETGADFTVFSPRKFFGVPDGALLVSATPFDPVQFAVEPPPRDCWLKAFTASLLRRDFDSSGEDNHWFDLFREVEAHAPIGSFAMSELSRSLLTSGLDHQAVAQKRIANYRLLEQSLAPLVLLPRLPAGVVPLGFPIRLPNRDEVRHALFAEKIYPPIHWEIGGFVPEKFSASHRLASETMTLPCDQRYTLEDMERICEFVSHSTVDRIATPVLLPS